MVKKIVTLLVVCAISASALAATKQTKQLAGTVNVNTATASELMMLPGIGKAKADAIIAYRQGSPFKSAAELTKVKGIGDKMLVKLQPFVTIDGPTTAKIVKTPVAAATPLSGGNVTAVR